MGYYSGAEEHFTHEKDGVNYTAYDLSHNIGANIAPDTVDVGPNGTYSTYIYGMVIGLSQG